MDQACSRVFFSAPGGRLLSCAVSQSAQTDRYSSTQAVPDGPRPAAAPYDDPPGPVCVPSDPGSGPPAGTSGVGVPWEAGSRVAPLFELCLGLAAGRLDRLESLAGFPELVGELLVRRALQLGVFDRPDERCRRALAVCVAAYPDQVLPRLRMPDQLTLSEYEESLESVWPGVARLDLSGCRLGDRHPVITHIATLSCLTHLLSVASLTHLHLRDCALTDTALRNLTLPSRMSGSGLTSLRSVDVRDNQLSSRSLLMLCRLKPERITASVTVNAETKAALESRGYRLVAPFRPDDVTTDGWLAALLDRWSHLAVRPPTKRARTEQSEAARFYGRPARVPAPSVPRPPPRYPPPVYLQRSAAAE